MCPKMIYRCYKHLLINLSIIFGLLKNAFYKLGNSKFYPKLTTIRPKCRSGRRHLPLHSTNIYQKLLKLNETSNRGNMRKIHVTRQFFEASGRHRDFFEKTKNVFLHKVYESMCTKFQVCVVFRLARRRVTNK